MPVPPESDADHFVRLRPGATVLLRTGRAGPEGPARLSKRARTWLATRLIGVIERTTCVGPPPIPPTEAHMPITTPVPYTRGLTVGAARGSQ